MKHVAAAILLFAFSVPILVYGVFACGYVASTIWGWYAVPLGLPAITWKTFAAGGLLVGVYRRFQSQRQPRRQAYSWHPGWRFLLPG
jgi:hypothetical protein